LEEYADNFYRILRKSSYYLPEKLVRRMPAIIEENWLVSYKEIDGIKTSVDRIAWKFSKSKHPLLNPIDELIRNYERLESDFKSFFPCAIEYANKIKEIY
jgi:acyl carrier protein phosphodiesterase